MNTKTITKSSNLSSSRPSHEDIPGHDRGLPVRRLRRADRRPPRPRHRVELRHVLLAHAGKGLTIFSIFELNNQSILHMFSIVLFYILHLALIPE